MPTRREREPPPRAQRRNRTTQLARAQRIADDGSAAHGARLLCRDSKADTAACRCRAVRGDRAGADGAEDGVPGRASGARLHGPLRTQDGQVCILGRRQQAEGEGEEGGVGLGLRELRGRVSARHGGPHARAAAGGRARGAALHAAPRRARPVQEALPAHALGVRVQRRAHSPLLPVARRPLRGHRGGGRRRQAEERGAHQEMQVLGNQWVRRHVRQHVQNPHAELLHQRVWAAPHHESEF